MKTNRPFFTILVLVFVFFEAIAQNNTSAIPLKRILRDIENKHKVNFSYLEKDVTAILLLSPENLLNLEAKINYLADKTNLKFELIANGYIAISKKNVVVTTGFYLQDATNLTPIEGANIKLNQANNVVISDKNGYFEIASKTVFQIIISHVNYEAKTVLLSDLKTKEKTTVIFLQPYYNELAEVITQSILTTGISKKIDGSIEIKPKKFGLLPGLVEPDIFETLKQIPGIVSTDETISNLNVRGGTHDQNLFLWNGIRLFQTGHFFGQISALNPNLAHNIKIFKNGSSAFYGEGISSVVDISTKSQNLEDTKTSIGFNLISADVNTKLKLSKNTDLEISARRSHTDLIKSPTYEKYYQKIFQNTAISNAANNEIIDYKNNENFYFYDATVQINQKISSKIEASLALLAITNLLTLNEFKTENSTIVSKKSSLAQTTYASSLGFNINWNKYLKTEIGIYGSIYNINSSNESITTNKILNQENTIIDTGLRIKNYHKINKNISLQSGYQLNEIGIRNFDKINSPTFFRSIKEVLILHALICEVSYKSNDSRTHATLGVRNNYIASFSKNIIEPRLQFNYRFTDAFSIEVLGERKSQVTSQVIDLQQDFLGIEKRRWILANDATIPIMRSSQISLGFTFKRNKWLVILDNFYKNVNGITSKSQGFQNQLEFLRINGSYDVIGSELLVQKRIRNFTGWISYSILRNNYNFQTFDPIKFPSNFDINQNITTALIYDYNQLKFALGSTFFSGKPNTLPLNPEPVFPTPGKAEIAYDLPNSTNLTNYFQLNFSGSKSFKLNKIDNLVVGFSIQNILDLKNTINQNFRINSNTNIIEQVNTFSLARTFNAFIRYNLY